MLANLQARVRQSAGTFSSRVLDENELERRRILVLFAVALFKLLNFFGGTWDIQWHVAVGRDNLFIPPHLLVLVAFTGGIILASVWLLYETAFVQNDQQVAHSVQVGIFRVSPAFYGIFLGYAGALLSGLFDEWWHRTFGIDSTLWSPPHLCIMASTMTVDYSLMIGISSSARRLGKGFDWRSPLFWGLGLGGAYLFEAVNFQMSQSFLEAYRVNGAGLSGILYPILVGAMFPMPMLLAIRIAGKFRVVLLMFGVAVLLQFIGTGVAATGFAILQPVSVIAEFMRLNPYSSIAQAAQFIARMGFPGGVGIQQEWTLALSGAPLILVTLLERAAWARGNPLLAGPIYSASLVIMSSIWIKQIPLMADYSITLPAVLIGVVLSACAGWILGNVGWRLGAIVPEPVSPVDLT